MRPRNAPMAHMFAASVQYGSGSNNPARAHMGVAGAAWGCVALVCVLLSCVGSAAAWPFADGHGASSAAADVPANYTALRCADFEQPDDVYRQIELDLAVHREHGGHTLAALRYASGIWGSMKLRGMTVGFFNGTAYLLVPTDFAKLLHHGQLHLAYMRQLLHIQNTFGAAIPDAAFIISTGDTPRYVSLRTPNGTWNGSVFTPARHLRDRAFVPGPYPIFGFCKSDFFPDLLLIPNFHYHMKAYDQGLLASIERINAQWPWAERKPVVFGRFSHYWRNRRESDPYTMREGEGGKSICDSMNKSCDVRGHFVDWASRGDHSASFDSRLFGFLPMLAHAGYRYLLHLDGQGASSRLEQLLPLGSLVFKEESGYYAYYHHLLKPYKHYLPFWKKRPEDILEALAWAREHDDEAQAIAQAGQQLAARYLTATGRACYWYRLLVAFAGTLSYKPSLSDWPKARPLWLAVDEHLREAESVGERLRNSSWAP